MGRVGEENPGQYWSGRLLYLCFLKVFSCVESLVKHLLGFSPDDSLLPSLIKGENTESEKQGQFSSISRACVLLNSKTEVYIHSWESVLEEAFIVGTGRPGFKVQLYFFEAIMDLLELQFPYLYMMK